MANTEHHVWSVEAFDSRCSPVQSHTYQLKPAPAISTHYDDEAAHSQYMLLKLTLQRTVKFDIQMLFCTVVIRMVADGSPSCAVQSKRDAE